MFGLRAYEAGIFVCLFVGAHALLVYWGRRVARRQGGGFGWLFAAWMPAMAVVSVHVFFLLTLPLDLTAIVIFIVGTRRPPALLPGRAEPPPPV